MEKLYPVGIQNFEKIRRDGYCYIDKTEKIYRLVKTGSYYFLSRPRRFGKSMLISTLEAYFQGKKELFGGLAMEGLEKEWKQYPILHLDLKHSGKPVRHPEQKPRGVGKAVWERPGRGIPVTAVCRCGKESLRTDRQQDSYPG